tara:strand:- start:903 stop:1217 length:315 start_codon:yes stop_codon:yes gene_type:complete
MTNTNWNQKHFKFDGMYLKYENRFIARFKNGGMVAFKKFLRENFTIEEYFNLLNGCELPPLKILETKGYISPQVYQTLKLSGYEPTPAGKMEYLQARRQNGAAQ